MSTIIGLIGIFMILLSAFGVQPSEDFDIFKIGVALCFLSFMPFPATITWQK